MCKVTSLRRVIRRGVLKFERTWVGRNCDSHVVRAIVAVLSAHVRDSSAYHDVILAMLVRTQRAFF